MKVLWNKIRDSIIKVFPVLMIVINVVCLVLGVIFLSGISNGVLQSILGILILAALTGNIITACNEDKHGFLGYGYLLLSFFGMFAVLAMNSYLSLNPASHATRSIISCSCMLLMFIYGAVMAGYAHNDRQAENLHIYAVPKNTDAEVNAGAKQGTLMAKVLYGIIIAVLCIILLSGAAMVFFMLGNQENKLIEVFIPEYALFFAFMFLSIGAILLKLKPVRRHFIVSTVILTADLLIFGVCLLPLLSVPRLLSNAQTAYRASFGDEYKKEPDNVSKYLRSTPFSIAEYFFGIPTGEYKLKENVLFYQGTEGVDKGLKLYFDVYTPPDSKGGLPGGHSVLIRIHGGGWSSGDKGFVNFAQMNKYFAAQGYVVFDIQYGINGANKLFGARPANVVGDFNVDDMIRHIGIFTKYLVRNKDRFNADLNSVFISGGSAGGHLSTAAGLAICSGNYRDILAPELTIKGIVPFYPGNGLAKYYGIDGSEELSDPTSLVRSDSPPCLIYQGDKDGYVDPLITKRFKEAYIKAGNDRCAVIMMPFGTHSSDLYFAGYYNQVFLYYMERFMYQYR